MIPAYWVEKTNVEIEIVLYLVNNTLIFQNGYILFSICLYITPFESGVVEHIYVTTINVALVGALCKF